MNCLDCGREYDVYGPYIEDNWIEVEDGVLCPQCYPDPADEEIWQAEHRKDKDDW